MQTTAIDALRMVASALEAKLEKSDVLPYAQKLALERAQGHVYEAMFWVSNADSVGGRIITP